jgi:hypothetical protein
MKPPLKKFSFKKIVPTLKLKLMATIDSKIIQRRPTKGYWQDFLELTYCTERREGNGVSFVQKN